MLAGVLWALGSLFVAVGICLFGGAVVLWAAPSAVALYLLGIPCRRAVTSLGSRCGKSLPSQQSSGFAEHIRRARVFNDGK